MPTLRRYNKGTDPTYYCKYCKKRHSMHSKIGNYHYWNVDFAKAHPNNCIKWEGLK